MPLEKIYYFSWICYGSKWTMQSVIRYIFIIACCCIFCFSRHNNQTNINSLQIDLCKENKNIPTEYHITLHFFYFYYWERNETKNNNKSERNSSFVIFFLIQFNSQCLQVCIHRIFILILIITINKIRRVWNTLRFRWIDVVIMLVVVTLSFFVCCCWSNWCGCCTLYVMLMLVRCGMLFCLSSICLFLHSYQFLLL